MDKELKPNSISYREWRIDNPEKDKKKNVRAWNVRKLRMAVEPEYRKQVLQQQTQWQQDHREEINTTAREHYVPSSRKNRYEVDRHRQLHNKKVRDRSTMAKVIWHYSKGTYRCACCQHYYIKDFLDIDHISGGGNRHRRANGIRNFHRWLIKKNLPPRFQVLCSLCNQGKRRNNGVCPHNESDGREPLYILPDKPLNIPYMRRRDKLGIPKAF